MDHFFALYNPPAPPPHTHPYKNLKNQNFEKMKKIAGDIVPPPNNPEIQNFEKMKKMPRDIIILNNCTKNHDDMPYCS